MAKPYHFSSTSSSSNGSERPVSPLPLDSNHNSSLSNVNAVRSRPSRGGLTISLRPGSFQIPLLSPSSPSKREIEEEGFYLFEAFVREEVCNEGLTLPPLLENRSTSEARSYSSHHYDDDPELVINRTVSESNGASSGQERLLFPENTLRSPVGYRNYLWTNTGRELRQLADEFARSKERRRVHEKAGEVNIRQITLEQFSAMLHELFSDGRISRERIITLFFFCTDVIIRALKQYAIDYCQRFMQWSLQFICDRVCSWVQQQGGWGVVLGSYVPKFLVTLGAIAVTLAAVVYIKKNW